MGYRRGSRRLAAMVGAASLATQIYVAHGFAFISGNLLNSARHGGRWRYTTAMPAQPLAEPSCSVRSTTAHSCRMHAKTMVVEESDDRKEDEDELTDRDWSDEESDDEEQETQGSGRPRNDPEWQFFDTAKIYVKAGDGGDGCVAFRREKCVEMGGPNGGSGGAGGSVYLRCSSGFNTLAGLRYKVHWKAGQGERGQGKSRTGSSAPDLFIDVPPGTVVRTLEGQLAGQLTEHQETMLVAKGGRGGRGNEAFKSNRNNAPKLAEKGEPGPERWLTVELKLVADVGLVGVPNAGKSTLLAAVSNARPKIADYPFTTIVPNLGVWDAQETIKGEWVEKGVVLADIPGLLEGAHQGVGLGLAFLRHVQRCRALVHVVNGDSPDPVGDYLAINQELELFSPKLAQKPQVVVLNKIDLPHVRERVDELTQKLKAVIPHSRFMAISAMKKENTGELMHRVWKMLRAMKQEEEDLFEGEVPIKFDDEEDEGPRGMAFQVITDPAYPGQFRVAGRKIETIVSMTNWDYYEAVERFQRILDATGINKALRKRGAKEGDLIMIGEHDFDYSASNNPYIDAAKEAGLTLPYAFESVEQDGEGEAGEDGMPDFNEADFVDESEFEEEELVEGGHDEKE